MGEPDGRHHLQVAEIFTSLQGEGRFQGELTVFIRLAGCNLRCSWCDTAYAYEGGAEMSIAAVIDAVRERGAGRICVTGGEPLGQPAAQELFTALHSSGLEISVETNGTHPIGGFKDVPSFSVDYKLSSAGATIPFAPQNWPALRPADELKFVVANRTDYDEAVAVIRAHDFAAPASMSPCLEDTRNGLVLARALASWIIDDKLPLRFSLQLHKILGIK